MQQPNLYRRRWASPANDLHVSALSNKIAQTKHKRGCCPGFSLMAKVPSCQESSHSLAQNSVQYYEQMVSHSLFHFEPSGCVFNLWPPTYPQLRVTYPGHTPQRATQGSSTSKALSTWVIDTMIFHRSVGDLPKGEMSHGSYVV